MSNPDIFEQQMSTEKDAKLKALKLTLDKLDKAYGKGTVMKMSDSSVQEVDVIPTGSLGLDLALGVGGYPRGRIVEIYGPESSGKTTLTLHAIAQAQKAGGIAAFIDAEHAFDRFYAEKLGAEDGSVADIFLPKFIADQIFRIFGAISVICFVLLLVRLLA